MEKLRTFFRLFNPVKMKIWFHDDKTPLHRRLGFFKKESPLQRPLKKLSCLLYREHFGEEDIPSCFVFSVSKKNKEYFYMGAFVISSDLQGINSVRAIYSRFSYQHLRREFMSRHNIAFWQARVLAVTVTEKVSLVEKKVVKKWVKRLQRYYSVLSGSEENNQNFARISTFLLSACCKSDNLSESHEGVEFMPWANWPECIKTENKLWIWRQNRVGRITSSQRISLADDKINDMPDELRN